MGIKEICFGKRIRTEDEQQEKISPLPGIPILGLDALASAAYGPEAALTVLLPLGVAAPAYIGPITLLIILLLFAVAMSYRQTIAAYPQGGGSFTVAKENLGQLPGLLAASALSIDYVLNVAVAISAGVGALVSAIPPLLLIRSRYVWEFSRFSLSSICAESALPGSFLWSRHTRFCSALESRSLSALHGPCTGIPFRSSGHSYGIPPMLRRPGF